MSAVTRVLMEISPQGDQLILKSCYLLAGYRLDVGYSEIHGVAFRTRLGGPFLRSPEPTSSETGQALWPVFAKPQCMSGAGLDFL